MEGWRGQEGTWGVVCTGKGKGLLAAVASSGRRKEGRGERLGQVQQRMGLISLWAEFVCSPRSFI